MPRLDDGLEARPILIGQAPSRYTQERDGPDVTPVAFSGYSGMHLAEILGISQKRLLEIFETINLLDRFPGRSKAIGDDFPIDPAKESARRLLPSLSGRKVLLAGRQVALAFGLGSMAFNTRRTVCWENSRGLSDVLLIPHPSRANSWWNYAANKTATAMAIKQFLGSEVIQG